ncbi:putative ribonuclease H-like domain-containing protein [Tanacetum coccineum]
MMGIPNEHQLKFNSIKDAKKLLKAVEKRDGWGMKLQKKTQGSLNSNMKTSLLQAQRCLIKLLIGFKTLIKLNLDTMRMDDLYNNLTGVCEQEVKDIGSAKSKVECLQLPKRETCWLVVSAKSRNQDNKNKESSRRSVPVETSTSTALVSCDGLVIYGCGSGRGRVIMHSLLSYLQVLAKDLKKSELMVLAYKTGLKSVEEKLKVYKANESIYSQEKDGIQLNVDKFKHASKSLNKLIECQIVDNCKKGLGYENYNAVPPPYTGNFMPPTPDLSFTGLDEFVNEHVVENSKVSDDEEEDVSQPKIEKKTVRPSIVKKEFVKSKQQEKTTRKTVKQVEQHRQNTHSPRGNQINWNNMMSQKLGSNFEMFNKACYVCGSFDHLQVDCNYHQKQFQNQRMVKPVWNNAQRVNHQNFAKKTHPCAKKNMVPRAVLMKSGLVSINTARQNISKTAVLVNTARQVNIAHSKTTVNAARPMSYLSKTTHSTVKRPIHKNKQLHLIKGDEGFFVGYSLNSKAFRVFNSRTRIVEENLHIRFSESTPNAIGSGPDWLFDIDALTRIMNYEPIVAGTQSNGFAGTKASDNAGQARKEIEPVKNYILLPLWTADPPYSQDPKSSHDDGSKPSSDDGKKVDEDPRKESECKDQEKENNVNSTNNVNTVSSTSNAAGTNEVNAVGGKTSIKLLFYLNMSALEDYSIFDFSRDDEDDGAVADMNNLDTTIQVSPNPTTRIHKDHPLDQVIGDLQSATQTRKMTDIEGNMVCLVLFNKEQTITTFKTTCLLAFYLKKNPKRLVAQGYTQEEGIDYDEVFALVARIEAIRLFLAYASFKDFMVYQMDVKSDFLYGKIKEEVYVCQPPEFKDPDFPDRVYNIEKALYRLHQAPRAWYETLLTYMFDNGFQRGKIDKILFIKRHKGDILLVQVYVDDIIFGSTKKELCISFETLMHEKFQMSSMGELTFFLGLQVQQKKYGIFISLDKYVVEILKKFLFIEVKTTSTPMETQKPLLKDEDGEEVDMHMYRSMISSLMYLTSSIPDIMFTVCACARYQVNSKVSHLHAVKRIFRYLKGQPKWGLWYPKDSPFDLVAYTYAGAILDRKSTTRGKAKKSVKLMMEKLFRMELELMLVTQT